MRTPRSSGTVRKAKGRLADEPDLIFNNSVLRSEDVTSACGELGHVWRERPFTPLVTLWAFIGQALNTDSSCKQAVARALSHLAFGTGERCKGDAPHVLIERVAVVVLVDIEGLPVGVVVDVIHRVGASMLSPWIFRTRRPRPSYSEISETVTGFN